MIIEELMEPLLPYLLDGQPHTVRITGHGASGKSTFARYLASQLPAEMVNLLETDPYIVKGELRSLVVPKQSPHQKVTASIPVSHEINSLRRDILALQSGLDILTIDEPWAPSQYLSAQKPILIVEGMSAAFLEKDLFDVSIACFTDEKTELERRLARDTVHRGRNPEFVKQSHQERREQYQLYLAGTLQEMDILIDQSQEPFSVQIKNHQLFKNEIH